MAMTLIEGGLEWPTSFSRAISSPTNSSGTAVSVTGNKCALIGRVWNKDRAQKTINKVGIKFGSVTKTGGSGLTLSLQNVLNGTGPAMRPDEILQGTWDIPNGDTNFVTNKLYFTGSLTANKVVDYGQYMAIVVEYNGSGRLGSDSWALQGCASTVAVSEENAGLVVKTGGAWPTTASINPIAALGFTDGTWGSYVGGWLTSQSWQTLLMQGSEPLEAGVRFVTPFDCKCDGAWFIVTMATGSSFEVYLYDSGGSVLKQVNVDGWSMGVNGSSRKISLVWDPVTLTMGQTYRLVLKCQSSLNGLNMFSHEVGPPGGGYINALPGGTNWVLTTKNTGLSFVDTDNIRPHIGLTLSHIDISSGATPEDWRGGPLFGRLIG